MRKTLIEGVRDYLIESPLRVRNFVLVSNAQAGHLLQHVAKVTLG
jgi:hypothetical protein